MGKNLEGKELGKGIRQRDNGLYDARTRINGYEIHISNFNLSLLKQEFNKLKKEAQKGNTTVFTSYTMNQWFEEWFKTYKSAQLKTSSLASIQSKYHRIFGKNFGDKNVKEVLNIDIQNCINEYLKTNKSLSELKSAFDNLSECFLFAKTNKIIKENPCDLISIPRVQQKPKNQELSYLTAEEESEFLNVLKDDWYYEMFYTLINTGMRVSELCGLKWKDVNFRNKYINIERQLICQYYKGKKMYFDTPKTQSGYRKIPFINNMAAVLKSQYKKVSERKLELGEKWRCTDEEYSDLVFYSIMGSPLTKDTIERAATAAVKKINKDRIEYDKFKKVHPHMFRHSFAVKCYENNIDVKTTQIILGHSNFATTMNIYTHVSDNDIANEVVKLNKFN